MEGPFVLAPLYYTISSFVKEDVLYPWTFCIYGCFVERTFVEKDVKWKDVLWMDVSWKDVSWKGVL